MAHQARRSTRRRGSIWPSAEMQDIPKSKSRRRYIWSAAPVLFLTVWWTPFSGMALASLTTGQSLLPHENVPINGQIEVAQNGVPSGTWACPPNASSAYYYQPGSYQGCNSYYQGYPPQSYYQGYPPQSDYQGYYGYSGGGGYGGYGGYSGGFGGYGGGGSGQTSMAPGSGNGGGWGYHGSRRGW
jgi:hypothetical protein